MAGRGPLIAGVDRRPATWDALELAAALSEQAGYSLLATWVSESEYSFGPYNLHYQQQLRWQVEAIRDELRPILDRVPPGRRREVRTFHALDPARGLRELAAAEQARLIVVGASHHSPPGRVLFGSTATRLLAESSCGVAVAPRGLSKRERRPIRTVGVALDGCRSCEAALDRARALAEELGAELVALTVDPHSRWRHGGEGTVERVEELLERGGATNVERVVLQGAPVEELVKASGDLDLLVTGARQTGGLVGRPTAGSVSRRLIRNSVAPVLVMPERAREAAGPGRAGAAAGSGS